MKLVVKIGGAALDDRELVGKFAKTIPDLCREGHKLVIVHGGGAALSRTLKQLGCRDDVRQRPARDRLTDPRCRHDGAGRAAQQATRGGHRRRRAAGHRHLRRRSAHLPRDQEEAARSWLRRRSLRRRLSMDRALVERRRCSGRRQPRARLRRRILQRERRPDGVGLRGGLWRRCARVSHRRCRGEGRRRRLSFAGST